ncbi:hypothetical protein G5V59_18830 [Nocardioides sp. W3-2-3]|uniref:hypothetical protein n=1 Tax=Nocardioides convexus TaxID=2712224 RepID=UPI0024187405|nr:hypothetical protein [Nocardioides convexus]NHA01216.1 hypothetical protein [Nocardioides convexus]
MKNLTTGNDDSRATLVRIGILVAIATMVATVVWLGARSRADDAGASDTAGGDNSSQTVENTSVEQVAPDTAPAEGVVIPTGTDQVDGHPTGFPATDLGAVALQVEVAKAQLGFDYDQAVTVAGLYADPEDKATFEERARAAVEPAPQAGRRPEGRRRACPRVVRPHPDRLHPRADSTPATTR